MRKIYNGIPAWLKNKYAITFLVFAGWMLFFDHNDTISQIKLHNRKQALEVNKEKYQEKIDVLRRDKEDLLTNKETLEKFAREKYYMKKDDEEIFVIVEEE